MQTSQLVFWETPIPNFLYAEPNLTDYDRFVVFQSGGKDSLAAILHLLECGVHPNLIELHHHCVDGREGSTLMDWPVTEAYCRAFAKAFDLKLYFSWKVGGFEGEMLRNNTPTAAVAYERTDGTISITGGDSKSLGTRHKFPQVTADLSQRWCSSYLKIMVGDRILTNELRFRESKTLVITGERAQESSARAKYQTFEPDRCDNRRGKKVIRHIDHWRPIHKWSEEEVWAIIERHRVNPHPAYWLGWGRVSCSCCIFGSPNQWATIKKYMPDQFEKIAEYEELFGTTIQRKLSIRQLAEKGVAYLCDPRMLQIALSHQYSESIIVSGQWKLPPGAFGESCGPL